MSHGPAITVKGRRERPTSKREEPTDLPSVDSIKAKIRSGRPLGFLSQPRRKQ